MRDGRRVMRLVSNMSQGAAWSGDPVTLRPVDTSTLVVGDIVLCKVRGSEYLHLVKATRGKEFLIGNNRGRTNGWISGTQILGKCVAIE